MFKKGNVIQSFEAVRQQHRAKSVIFKQFDLPSISTLNSIFLKKEEFINAYESNCPSTRTKLRGGDFAEFDEELYEGFQRMRGNKIEVSGDLLIQQVKVIASKQQLKDFSASQGFLDRFKKRYGSQFKKFHGQGGSVSNSIINYWAEKVRNLLCLFNRKTLTTGMKLLFFPLKQRMPPLFLNLKPQIKV